MVQDSNGYGHHGGVNILPRQLLNGLTQVAFPEYRGRVHPITESSRNYQAREVMSNLQLQILVNYNIVLTVIWIIYTAAMIIYRNTLSQTRQTTQTTDAILLLLGCICEYYRLQLGYTGNLLERVPELVGFSIASICPMLFITVYFLVEPFRQSVLPFEYSLNGWYSMMLLVQATLGYSTVKKLINSHNKIFSRSAE
ncbi:hypothetical protein MP228_012391 [Amoeboaphelidium protococcarum]|nr:hypothetical protein MP228_012391 [Amoeboaphelidium protococcarum]